MVDSAYFLQQCITGLPGHWKLIHHILLPFARSVTPMYLSTGRHLKTSEATGGGGEADDEDLPGGCILAHIMGLGKTLTTIAFLHVYLGCPAADEKPRRILVVVPANVLFNFYAEVGGTFYPLFAE